MVPVSISSQEMSSAKQSEIVDLEIVEPEGILKPQALARIHTQDILPFPKCIMTEKRKRKVQKAEILTLWTPGDG